MIVKALGAAFAPDAGIADAAPGRGRIEPVMIIDPDNPAFHLGRHAMGARDVAGADRGRKPERRVVRKPQRLFLVLEWRNRRKGAEHLLLEDAHIALDVGEHCGFNEISVLMTRDLCWAAAGEQARALVAADTAIGQHAVALLG